MPRLWGKKTGKTLENAGSQPYKRYNIPLCMQAQTGCILPQSGNQRNRQKPSRENNIPTQFLSAARNYLNQELKDQKVYCYSKENKTKKIRYSFVLLYSHPQSSSVLPHSSSLSSFLSPLYRASLIFIMIQIQLQKHTYSVCMYMCITSVYFSVPPAVNI